MVYYEGTGQGPSPFQSMGPWGVVLAAARGEAGPGLLQAGCRRVRVCCAASPPPPLLFWGPVRTLKAPLSSQWFGQQCSETPLRWLPPSTLVTFSGLLQTRTHVGDVSNQFIVRVADNGATCCHARDLPE